MTPKYPTAWRWGLAAIRVVGFTALVGYLWTTSDWRFSLVALFGYPAIATVVAVALVAFKLHRRFPALDEYWLYPRHERPVAKSDDEWALMQAQYHLSRMSDSAVLLAASEDGLICVPLLLMGTSAAGALAAGLVFGLLHLPRFTYLECLAKAFIYGFVCYLILPFGLLTVVAGHLLTDAIALTALKVADRRLRSASASGSPPTRG